MTDINSEVEMGYAETFAIMVVCMTTKMFYSILPSSIAEYGTASWYIAIIAGVISAAVFYYVAKSNKGILDVFNDALGKIGGKILGFILYGYFLLYASTNLKEIIKIIKIYNFPSTPIVVFAVAFLLVALLINFNGLYGVSKLAEFYLKLILITFFLIFAIGLGQYEFIQLVPYGGYGIGSIAKGSFLQTSIFGDIFLLMVLIKQAGGGKTAGKIGITAIASSIVIVAMSMISYMLIFDYTVSKGKSAGLIEVVKNMYYGHLFQRMESLFFLMMTVASAVAVCIWFFGSVHIFSEVFSIDNKKEILLPTALIMLVICLATQSDDTALSSFMLMLRRYGGIFVIGIPLVVKTIAVIRRRA